MNVVAGSPWARHLYPTARRRGIPHPHAIRILARAWLRVIWACWQTDAVYAPAHHLRQEKLVYYDDHGADPSQDAILTQKLIEQDKVFGIGGMPAPQGANPYLVQHRVPLIGDLGFRFTPNLYLGVTGSYQLGLPKNCASGVSCSGHLVTLGLDVRYHLLPDLQFDPWVGLGLGYEWFGLSASAGGSTADATANGFEFVHFQLGAISRWGRT